ncbi:MAG: ATP-binding protein [Kiritimatiellia bacterium]|nr:ATP-binding protein [Kiritimatiellia bacterium]MDP6809444.1 ATP-binding protein [Kiritimatiellia bacterium]MDP7023879.1 ATP-binding protein [Kiritimatiellia bacterium]
MSVSVHAEEVRALIDIAQTINAHLSIDAVLESVMSVAKEVMAAEASSLFTVDDDTGELLFHVAQGEKAERVKPIRMQPGQGIVGHVVETGEPLIVNDVANDSRWYAKPDEESGFKTRSILCVPLRTPERLLGAIEILNKIDGPFTESDLALCQAVAGQAAVAIENAMLHEQMLEKERMAAIGETVAGLSHCIKNILQGVKTGSYLVNLGMKREDMDLVGKGWTAVSKKNDFMEELVWDLLTLSKPREPLYEATDLNALCEDICEIGSQREEGEPSVTVDFKPDPNLPEVEADGKGMRRCLLNLVTNAVDACTDGGTATVGTLAPDDDGKVRVVVSDTGCGMDEETVNKLFTVFFSTKGSKGTGLGLPVTKKIVEEHGGLLEIASEKGKGTTFTVVLPQLHEDWRA